MTKPIWTKEQFIDAVKTSTNRRQVIEKLGLKKMYAGNYQTVNRYVKEYDLDISHFKHGTATNFPQSKLQSKDIFVSDSRCVRTVVKRRILQEHLLKYECEICGISEWLGAKLVLQLDHKNGRTNDNRLDNLRFLCPNCHSQTPTFSRTKTNKQEHKCKICSKQITPRSIYCPQCAPHARTQKPKIDWPDTATLLDMVSKSNYTKVAKELGVSDNALRKRLKTRPPSERGQ